MDVPSTASLLEQVRDGSERAFDALVRRHEATLLCYARGLLGAGGAYEDAVQDAFWKLARNPPRLAREHPELEHQRLGRWLLQVTRNHCMDWMRAEKRRRRREADCAVPEATLGGIDALEVLDSSRVVEAHLEALPEAEREVLVLRLLAEKSYREIAEVTGRPVGTVGWLISQGLQRLATQLAPVLGHEPGQTVIRRAT